MQMTSRERKAYLAEIEEDRNRSADKKRKASEKTRTPTKERQQEINRERLRKKYNASELEDRAKRQASKSDSDSPRARVKPDAPSKDKPSDKPTTIAEARKMGSKYYYKDGKKMAAVTAEQLKASGYDSLSAYMNAWKDPKNPPKKSEFRDSNKGAASSKGLYNKGGMATNKRNTMGAGMNPNRSMKNGRKDYR